MTGWCWSHFSLAAAHRAPPLIRKTRAQLKELEGGRAGRRQPKQAAQQRRSDTPAGHEEEAAGQEPLHEGQLEEEEDADAMDALDAFSALAGGLG